MLRLCPEQFTKRSGPSAPLPLPVFIRKGGGIITGPVLTSLKSSLMESSVDGPSATPAHNQVSTCIHKYLPVSSARTTSLLETCASSISLTCTEYHGWLDSEG